jgi:hypothetical protein
MARPEGQPAELCGWQQGAIFLFACIVLVTRRPDAIFHAQFYAEDGHVWFADAYNLGWWHTLLRAQDGYLQTLPRLAAALALLAPLSLAPLVLNLAALAVEALPVNLLLSSRTTAWGSLRFRALLAAVYLVLPNGREMLLIVTSSQWILALCVFLVITASARTAGTNRVFDYLVLLLCGLTGPFCFFLVLIALFVAWKRGEAWRWIDAGLLAATSLVQAWALLVMDAGGRSHAPLGASAALFIRMLAGHIYFGALLGGNGLSASTSPDLFAVLVCVAIGGTAVVTFCFIKSAMEMRLFLVLTGLLLTASLVSPAAYPPPGVSRWELLAQVPGIRYWFFPTLAFGWCLLWGIRSRGEILKPVSTILLGLMCVGVVRDWRDAKLRDLHFTEFAQRFESAPVGTTMVTPENPDGWNIQLIKRRSR